MRKGEHSYLQIYWFTLLTTNVPLNSYGVPRCFCGTSDTFIKLLDFIQMKNEKGELRLIHKKFLR